jgi:hypothetical protein
MRYICKSCGAESPRGIGYAANDQTVFPMPAVDCREAHMTAGLVVNKPGPYVVGSSGSTDETGRMIWTASAGR